MFELLIINVAPLYGLILLGFVVGKYADLDVNPVATIMLYAILPIVMFGATATMEFTYDYMLAPLIIASISLIASTSTYLVSKKIWGENDKRHNLLGMLGVSSNATYFGIPIALAFAGQEWIGVYIMMVMPLFIMDCTLGYYLASRGDCTVRGALIRVAKLPIIYGAISGLIFNTVNIEMPVLFIEYWERFTGTTIILGMMIIGAGLSKMDKFRFDPTFFAGVIIQRYILWPGLAMLWVLVDILYLHMLSDTVHGLLVLVGACPLAANTVAYATKLNLHPALTACMVLITTVIALAFIPLMMSIKDILF